MKQTNLLNIELDNQIKIDSYSFIYDNMYAHIYYKFVNRNVDHLARTSICIIRLV